MKTIQLSALLALAFFTITSCQPEEEAVPTPMEEITPLEFDPTVANEFTYRNNTQTITDAILLGDGTRNPDGRISWQLYLTTGGLIDAEGNFNGQGDFIFLELNTGNPEGLVSSTYVLNGTSQQLTYNQTSSLYEDFDVQALQGSVTNIRSGEITLTVQGDQIIAEFDFDLAVPFLSQTALPLTGQYQGNFMRL